MLHKENEQTGLFQMTDFHRLASMPDLTIAQKKSFLAHPHFFRCPKPGAIALREHSCLLDKILGFNVRAVEGHLLARARALLPNGNHTILGEKLHRGRQTWIGLDPQTLNTPYDTLRSMALALAPKRGEIVADLGAGYGRLGLVLANVAPGLFYLGQEYVSERVHEAVRVFMNWGAVHAHMEVSDLIAPSYQLPDAHYYFIYDYGTPIQIEKTLRDLKMRATKTRLSLVAAGSVTRSMLKNKLNWPHQGMALHSFQSFDIYSN